jgi:hypothetical protein
MLSQSVNKYKKWIKTRTNIGIVIIISRVLRGVFGPKRDEATGEWRKLHNE